MAYGIVEFETAVLVLGFITNLLIGGGIVFTAYTVMSESVGLGAIIGIVMTGITILVERWIGYEVIAFDTFAQIEAAMAVSVVGGAIGALVVITAFEPQFESTTDSAR